MQSTLRASPLIVAGLSLFTAFLPAGADEKSDVRHNVDSTSPNSFKGRIQYTEQKKPVVIHRLDARKEHKKDDTVYGKTLHINVGMGGAHLE